MFRPSFVTRLRRIVGVRTNIPQPALKSLNKSYDETENGFAFKVLRSGKSYNLPSPEESIHRLKLADDITEENFVDVNWNDISTNRFCRTFNRVSIEAQSKGHPISDMRYNEMCSWFPKRCPEMSDSQLKEMLIALSFWPTSSSPFEPNLMAVWKSIDSVMVSRYKEYSIEKILEFTNLWYQVGLIRKSDFVFHGMSRVSRRPGRLMPHQVVLLLFYQNLLRTFNKNVPLFPIEERLAQVVDGLSMEEVGIACMGFFKTQHPINSKELAKQIVDKLLKNADTIHEITLASIMKALRYKLPFFLWDQLPLLMDAMKPQIARMSITASVHVPLMLTASQTLHEEILDTVAEKLVQNPENARLKDMEKVLLPLTLLNYTPKTSSCVFQTVVEQLDVPEREEEYKNWPKCLVSVLQFLAVKGIFVDRLIDRVLDIDFVRSTYGKTNYNIGREVLFIDGCVEFEHPSYSGHRLPVDVRNYLSKRHSCYLPDKDRKMSKHMLFEYDVMQTIDRLTNSRYASKYVLPNHARADHIIRVEKDGCFTPLPDDFIKSEPFNGTLRAPGDGYVALVPIGRNTYIRNRDDVNGETHVKLRQLGIIGYNVVTIGEKTWPDSGTEEEKEKHLLESIRSSVPNCKSQ